MNCDMRVSAARHRATSDGFVLTFTGQGDEATLRFTDPSWILDLAKRLVDVAEQRIDHAEKMRLELHMLSLLVSTRD